MIEDDEELGEVRHCWVQESNETDAGVGDTSTRMVPLVQIGMCY